MKIQIPSLVALTLACLATWAVPASAQPPASTNAAFRPRGGRGGMQRVAPVDISADRHLLFHLSAPNAQTVRLVSSDLPIRSGSVAMTNANGIWEITLGPVEPGVYRYSFNIDGLSFNAPHNPATNESFTASESSSATFSLLYIPGENFMDFRDVPHGAVEAVTYYSKSLNRFRRMHVYLPPGYQANSAKYPVLFLLPGFSESDDAWATVGRAGFIMDNLIADNKAAPMILIMPSVQTSFGFGGGRRGGGSGRDEFGEDLLGDIIPYIESHYHAYADQAHRAIAGITSGGSQALNLVFGTPDKFGYVGLFSTAAANQDGNFDNWEQSHVAALDNPNLKQNLKLLWISAGQDDLNIQQYRDTVGLLDKHGLKPIFTMSKGENTWRNWSSYLNEFAPQLFK